jgi:hypothetical protein
MLKLGGVASFRIVAPPVCGAPPDRVVPPPGTPVPPLAGPVAVDMVPPGTGVSRQVGAARLKSNGSRSAARQIRTVVPASTAIGKPGSTRKLCPQREVVT